MAAVGHAAKRLTLVIREHGISPSGAKFTMRNGDGLAQFSGIVKLTAIPKLTAMVFESLKP